MIRLNIDVGAIDAIVVTHEHGDHAKGVAALSRKYHIPVYMTQGTWLAKEFGELPEINLLKNYENFSVGDIEVQPVAVPHDAREPAQYVFASAGLRLGVLTDLGSVTPHVIAAFKECDALLLEANHDVDMLWNGPYPPALKTRVASDWGHLNNKQAAELLDQIYSERLQKIVVGHISQKNNTRDLARKTLLENCQIAKLENAVFACQEEGFDWLEICS